MSTITKARPTPNPRARTAAPSDGALVATTSLSIGRLSPVRPERDRRVARLARHPNDGWIHAEPMRASRRLSRKFRGVIRAMVPPPDPAPDLEDYEARIEHYLLKLFAYMNPLTRFVFRLAIRVLDQAPRWTFKSWRPLHALPRERAEAILHVVADGRYGPARDLLMVARAGVLAAWFDQSEVHEALEYRPEAFMTERIALRQRLLAGDEGQDQDLLVPREDLP